MMVVYNLSSINRGKFTKSNVTRAQLNCEVSKYVFVVYAWATKTFRNCIVVFCPQKVEDCDQTIWRM